LQVSVGVIDTLCPEIFFYISAVKKIFFVFFIFSWGNLQAQSWQTVVSTRIGLFDNQGNNFLRAIRIDSTTVSGNDSIFINYHSIDDNYYDITPYSWSPECLMDTSWIGCYVIIKANGDNVFVNESLDSILLKPRVNLNDSWIMYQYSNGNYIEATITALGYDSIFTVTDSTKEISLQLKDSIGINLNANFNGHQFTISKNYALVKTLSLRNFPSAYLNFELKGIDGVVGYQNLKAADIYDFNIGDVFQYYNKISTLNGYQIFRIQHTILSKTFSANLDSITYVIDDSTWFEDYNPAYTGTLIHSISTEIIDLSSTHQVNVLNILPHEVSDYDIMGYNLFGEQRTSSIYNGRSYKNVFGGLTIEIPYLCGGYHFNPGDYWCWTTKYSYSKGLGKVYEENVNPYATHFCEWHLTYFKKGAETWGNPVNLIVLSADSKNYTSMGFYLSPNPTTGKLKIQTEKLIESIQVFNLFGEKVLEATASNEIDLADQPPGIYFIRIQAEGKIQSFKIVRQ
jgi:hypothetical protein